MSRFFARLVPSAASLKAAAELAKKARKHVALAEQIASAAEEFGDAVDAGEVSIVIGRGGITLMRHTAQASAKGAVSESGPQIARTPRANKAK